MIVHRVALSVAERNKLTLINGNNKTAVLMEKESKKKKKIERKKKQSKVLSNTVKQ